MLLYEQMVEALKINHPNLIEVLQLDHHPLDVDQWLIFAREKIPTPDRYYHLRGEHYCAVEGPGASIHTLWIASDGRPGLHDWLRERKLIHNRTPDFLIGLPANYVSAAARFTTPDIAVLVPQQFHPKKARITLFSPTQGRVPETVMRNNTVIASTMIQQRLIADESVRVGFPAQVNGRVHVLAPPLPKTMAALLVKNLKSS